MELYRRTIELIDANLVFCLIPIILTLILVEFFFQKRFETRKALNLIRWFIIFYTVITWTFYLIGMALNPEEYAFVSRATGRYKIAYWIMFSSALILPFTLLIKKLASKFWYVLLVGFCIKIGVYFERFVLLTISFHRDYLPENENTELIESFLVRNGMIFLQGIIITIFTLTVLEVTKLRKTVHNPG